MNQKSFRSLFGVVIVVAMMFSILSPGLVLAEDATTEPVATEEPSLLEETQAPDQPEVGLEEQNPAGETTPEGLLETEEASSVGDATPTPDGDEEAGSALDEEGEPGVEESTDANDDEEPPLGDDLVEVVSLMAENGAVLLDETGEPLSMASEAAQEILSTVGDPRGTLGVARDGAPVGASFTYYKETAGHADGDCSYDGATTTLTCYFAAPLSQAVVDAEDNSEILIAPEVFHETVSINKKLILTGDGGIATVDQFILLSGADLTGSSNIFANWVEVQSGASVQDGINLVAENGTVDVLAGTYEEQLSIQTDGITLQGHAGTVIKSPLTLVTQFSTSTAQKPIIYVHGDDVTIDGITVDGAGRGNGNYRFSGVAFHNASGTLSNSLITAIRDSTLSGSQHGIGIYAYNTDGVGRVVNIFNNTIVDFQKNAMALDGMGLTVNVDGNTVTGAGLTLVTAQNGIQISRGATGTVSNNTISDIWYRTDEGDGSHAAGILLYLSGGSVQVSNNTVTNTQDGVLSANSIFTATDNTFGNSMEGVETGILAYDGSGFTATGNSIISNVNGIYAEESPFIASGNSISNSLYGIYGFNSPFTAINNTVQNTNYGIIDMGAESGSQVLHNYFLNNMLGFYGNDPTATLRDNLFIGNLDGAWFNLPDEGIGEHGIYNYWGCDAGPDGTSPNCNTALSMIYDPWLIDPDGDWVFESSDGTGGYVDNCPTVANPDQADSDEDGIGDACEETPVVPTVVPTIVPPVVTPTPIVIPVGPSGIIPVTGGEMQKLVCPTGSDAVVLTLENGDLVRFIGLCELDAVLSRIGEEALPGAVPADMTYVSDMMVQVLDEGVLLELFTGGSIELSFVIPKDFKDANLGLMVWDDETESWVEIPMDSPELEYPVSLTDDPQDQRVILNGLSPEALRALSRENFSGLFMLVAK